MKREIVYEAVFQVAKNNVSGIKNYSRRLRLEGGYPSVEMPALFQVQKSERSVQKQKLPVVWEISLDWVIYFSSGGNNEYVISTDINNIIDDVEELFTPDKISGLQNLGLANVSHAWISDLIEISEGILGEAAIVLVPIKILVAGQK
jgi:hypothetical protein